MTLHRLTCYAAYLILTGCAVEPANPSLVFEGTIMSRAPFYGGADTLPAMLVDSDPGASPDQSCGNRAAFFLRDVKRLAFANGMLARVDDLRIGARVRVWWDGSQLDSCPPRRRADRITILP